MDSPRSLPLCASFWLSPVEPTELLQTAFYHPLLPSEIRSKRGRASGTLESCGTFAWSPAVQALTALFVQSAAALAREENTLRCGAISGEAESPAASLDYALSKQPAWLTQIFGCDSNGITIARRIILRENPERRRPGPVVLGLNPRQFEPGSIRIYVGDSLISCPERLRQIADQLLTQWKSRGIRKRYSAKRSLSSAEPLSERRGGALAASKFAAALKHEIRSMLRATDIFSADSCQRMLEAPTKKQCLSPWRKRGAPFLSEVDRELTGADRVGLAHCETEIRRELCGDEPIRCAVPVGTVSTAALFTYLAYEKGYNVEINYRYAHTTDLAERMKMGRFSLAPDICQLSMPATMFYLASSSSQRPFLPFMFCPKVSHRIVGPASASAAEKAEIEREFLMMSDTPSGSSMYFEHLLQSGIIRPRSISVQHKEPIDTLKALSCGDKNLRGVLWFPYYYLASEYAGCSYTDECPDENSLVDGMLFAHESLLRNRPRARSLNIALRDAWLELASNQAALDAVVERMIGDPSYMSTLRRCTGAHHLDSKPVEARV